MTFHFYFHCNSTKQGIGIIVKGTADQLWLKKADKNGQT